MATLAEINDTLVAQNAILSETNEGVKSTSSNIDKLVKQMAGDRMDALEDKAEERRITKKQSDVTSAKMASDTSSGFSLPSLPFGGLGKLFAAGSLVGLGATLGKTLLTRGIPGAVLNLFADEIADYIESKIKDPKEAKVLSDAAFGAIKGLSIGMIFGKRFAFIGTILGGIISNEEVRKEFDTLGDNLRKELDDLGIKIPSFATVLKGITGTITNALRTINSLFGDGKDANGKEIEKDFGAVAATFGGLALLLAPGTTFRLALKSIGALARVIPALTSLGLAGLSAGAASAGTGAAVAGAGAAGVGAAAAGAMGKTGLIALLTSAPMLAAFGLIAAAVLYAYNKNSDDRKRYEELKAIPPRQLSMEQGKELQNLSAQFDAQVAKDQQMGNADDPEAQMFKQSFRRKFVPKKSYTWSDYNAADPEAQTYVPKMLPVSADLKDWNEPGAFVIPQKATVTKRQPQTAPAVAEAATTATANNIRPVIVQSNNNPISTTTVSSPQAFMAPSGSVFDMSDGFLIGRGFSR
jgi:hypothetical protein